MTEQRIELWTTTEKNPTLEQITSLDSGDYDCTWGFFTSLEELKKAVFADFDEEDPMNEIDVFAIKFAVSPACLKQMLEGVFNIGQRNWLHDTEILEYHHIISPQEELVLSENTFETLAKEDPYKLIRLIERGLEPHMLTFAAEHLGEATIPEAGRVLVGLAQHEKPVVREGAIYGLQTLLTNLKHKSGLDFDLSD